MTNYDGPWKETFDEFCPAALELLFPDVHAHIDWQRPVEYLDTELRQIVADAQWGKGIVDKLIKVWLKDGEENWLLLHLEIQAQSESGFALRMFAYRNAIFLRYNREIVSLAVLGDDQPSWRPNEYRTQRLGCELRFRFPTVKLLDFLPRIAELEASSNPVAHVVLAHLLAQQTTNQMERRKVYKFELVRKLYELGFEAEVIRKLFRLIDWMMTLPIDLETLFRKELVKLEEGKKMPYVTSIERLARQEGQEEGRRLSHEVIETLLAIKFGDGGTALADDLRKIDSLDHLHDISQAIKTGASLEQIQVLVRTPA